LSNLTWDLAYSLSEFLDSYMNITGEYFVGKTYYNLLIKIIFDISVCVY
jgi:hypothetical protein